MYKKTVVIQYLNFKKLVMYVFSGKNLHKLPRNNVNKSYSIVTYGSR